MGGWDCDLPKGSSKVQFLIMACRRCIPIPNFQCQKSTSFWGIDKFSFSRPPTHGKLEKRPCILDNVDNFLVKWHVGKVVKGCINPSCMESRPELRSMLLLDFLRHKRIIYDGQICRVPVNRNGDRSSFFAKYHFHFITAHHRMTTMKVMVYQGENNCTSVDGRW